MVDGWFSIQRIQTIGSFLRSAVFQIFFVVCESFSKKKIHAAYSMHNFLTFRRRFTLHTPCITFWQNIRLASQASLIESPFCGLFKWIFSNSPSNPEVLRFAYESFFRKEDVPWPRMNLFFEKKIHHIHGPWDVCISDMTKLTNHDARSVMCKTPRITAMTNGLRIRFLAL